MGAQNADESLLGRTIAGKYTLEGVLGSGAMGAVYKARQLGLDKVVAVKVMHSELAIDATFAARFKREAKASSRLDHPNSIRVIDYGEDGGLLFMVLEYLDGRDLLKVLREDWPLSPQRIVEIVLQTLAALAVAHDLGIVHRDLKPENIMVLASKTDDGQATDHVKVCDFGIAKLTDSRSYQTDAGAKGPLTRSGSIVGTPEYMSPEQGRGDKLDARADIYSVGVILYQLLTGRMPFVGENAIGIILKHITEEPERPCHVNPGADPGLEQICLKAMRKKREDRHASAREMRAELRAVQQELGGLPTVPRSSHRQFGSGIASDAAIALTAVDGVLAAPPALSATPTTATNAEVELSPRTLRSRKVAIGILLLIVGIPIAIGVVRLTQGAAAEEREAKISQGPAESAPPTPPSAPPVLEPPVKPHPSAAPPKGARTAARPSASPPIAPAGSLIVKETPAAPASAPILAPVPPAPMAPVAPAAPAGPPFVADNAFVEISFASSEHVAASDVKAALKQANLSACYKAALRAKGARAGGNGSLFLSIDEAGTVRSALLRNNDFLPQATACVQSAATGIRLRAKAVEEGAGGATAEVLIIFHPE